MHVKSITECSKVSILQYFRTSLGCHKFVNKVFVFKICLFLSDHLSQVLLYIMINKQQTTMPQCLGLFRESKDRFSHDVANDTFFFAHASIKSVIRPQLMYFTFSDSRVKSGKFGHLVNSDTRLQTV